MAPLCLATLMLAGCNRYDEKIIGTWKMDYWMLYSPTSTNGDTVDNWFFTFNKGGKGVMTSPKTNPYDSTIEVVSTAFDYSINDEELYMSLPDFESNHIEKLEDRKMILSQTSFSSAGQQMIEFSFTKK